MLDTQMSPLQTKTPRLKLPSIFRNQGKFDTPYPYSSKARNLTVRMPTIIDEMPRRKKNN